MKKGLLTGSGLRLREVLSAQRIVTNVACLAGDVDASRRALAEGLYRLFRARRVSVLVYDRWNADAGARVVHDVHFGPADPTTEVTGETSGETTPDGSPEGAGRRSDPLTEHLLKEPRTVRTFHRRDLMDDTEWAATPAATHLERIGTGDILVSGFPLPDGGALTVAIHFAKDAPPVTHDQRNLLHLISLELRRVHQQRGIGQAGVRPKAAVPEMTPRERQVFEAMLGGHSVKEIARRIGVKDQTVAGYVKVIYRHLGVHSRGELMARYLRS